MDSIAGGLFKSVGNKVRQFAFNLTETELKVEEATNNDPWGPHGTLMGEIARMTFDPERYREVMQVLARRLTDSEENWRHVYKSLLLMEFLVKNGPMKVLHELQSNISFLEELKSFKYKDKAGKDHGLNVRNRAKELCGLISDQERVLAEREKAQKNKQKYSGASKDELRFASTNNYSPRGAYQSDFRPSDAGFGRFDGGNFGDAPPKSSTAGFGNDDDDEENPFEATRRRIERLKVDGKLAIPQNAEVGVSLGGAGGGLNSPLAQAGKKEPKKLSQVKVNPEIAAAFSKMHITPAAGSAPPIAQFQGSNNNPPASTGIDLLGGLEDPPPVSSQGRDLLGTGLESLEVSPGGQAAGGGDWSSFQNSTAPLQNQAQSDPVDPFLDLQGPSMPLDQAPPVNPNPPQNAPSDPFATLVGGGNSTQNAGVGISPLPDMFAPMPAPSPVPSPQTTQPAFQPTFQPVSPSFVTQQQPVQAATMDAGFGNFGGSDPMSGMGFASNGNMGAFQSAAPNPGVGMSMGTSPAVSGVPDMSSLGSKGSGGGMPGSKTTAPMRPGASRPATSQKKDPFADLAVL